MHTLFEFLICVCYQFVVTLLRLLLEEISMAQLTQLTISGFKSISSEHPICLDIGRITIILGANGAGKSNIISFLKMMNYMMSGSFSAYVAQNGGCQSLLHYGPKSTSSIKGNLKFESKYYKDNYDFTLSFAAPDNLVVAQELVEFVSVNDTNNRGSRRIELEQLYRESALSKPSNSKTLQIIRNILSRCKVYQFHDSSSSAGMRNSCDVHADNYLYSEAGNIAAFLYRLKRDYPNHYEQIVSYVRLIVPQFHDFILEPDSVGRIMLKWTDTTGSDYIYTPMQFSDGSMRFIALATLLLQPRDIMPHVIIIDEPELGLHPYAITQLAEMIKEAAENTQVIIATQSPALVDEFEANQVVVVETNDTGELIYSTARRLDTDSLEGWLNSYTISELWEKNIIGGRPQ